MALSISGVYRLAVEELRDHCAEFGLVKSGTVRELRQSLTQHIRAIMAEGQDDVKRDQLNVPNTERSGMGSLSPPAWVVLLR